MKTVLQRWTLQLGGDLQRTFLQYDAPCMPPVRTRNNKWDEGNRWCSNR